MQPDFPFQPSGANVDPPTANTSLAVTASVQQLTIPVIRSGVGTIRIVVSGTQEVAWSFGVAPSLTLTNGVAMLPNTVETFTVPPNVTQISVVAAATGSTIRVHTGYGQ